MALNVGIEHLDCVLGEKAFMEVLVILYQRQPGFQQPVICLHVHHVVFVQLGGRGIHKTDTSEMSHHRQVHSLPFNKVPNQQSATELTDLIFKLTDQLKHCSEDVQASY